MDINEFDQGMDLAFRINDLQKDVAAFLKDDCRPVLQNVVSLLSEKQVSSAGQSE